MKKFKLKHLLLWGLAVFAGYLPVNIPQIANPAQAQTTRQMGISPQEMGKEKYVQLVRQARQSLSNLPPDTQLMFPLGSQFPIRLEVLEAGQGSQPSRYQAIGYVTLSGEPKAITVAELVALFDYDIESYNYSHLPGGFEPRDILIADTSVSIPPLPQPSDVITLLIVDTATNQVKLEPNVRFLAFLTYAINAVLNNDIQQTNIDASQVDLNRVRNLLPQNPVRSPL